MIPEESAMLEPEQQVRAWKQAESRLSRKAERMERLQRSVALVRDGKPTKAGREAARLFQTDENDPARFAWVRKQVEHARKVAALVAAIVGELERMPTHSPVAMACRAAKVEDWHVPTDAELDSLVARFPSRYLAGVTTQGLLLDLELRALGLSRAIKQALAKPKSNDRAWVDVVLREKIANPNLAISSAAQLAGTSERSIRRHEILSKMFAPRPKGRQPRPVVLNANADSSQNWKRQSKRPKKT